MIKVIATGRVTRDVETRTTQGGQSISNFCVVSSRFYKGEEKSTFLDVNVWNNEFVQQHIKKGSVVEVTGDLEQESWEDKKTGEKRSKLVMKATDVQFGPLPPKNNGNAAPAPQSAQNQVAPRNGGAPTRPTRTTRQSPGKVSPPKQEELPPMGGDSDDDVPF